ncbi:putative uncharacterized oxidoreductase [Lachnellula occidentalis]|uniref:Uncharacterized oxidoreductase n=1 Tax=Lachnellula occidentalis TaxID=215460 RepID=A0A8H8RS82_9HELO|nr:putative uncharacterized oxidoreductase [Lachnellula occidentalis]
MPSKGLIFLTGGTGFIGSSTTLIALRAGYNLRLAVRQESQIAHLKDVFSEYLSSIDFVLVPDIAADDAYAGKLEGVDYVIHIASPIPRSLVKEEVLTPAVKGTLGILAEAKRVGSVKRVVITSSIVALIPLAGLPEGGVIKERETNAKKTNKTILTPAEDNNWDLTVDPTADMTQETDFHTSIHLYFASKLLANTASQSFMSTQAPPFTLVTLHPSCVVGHHLLQTHSSQLAHSTNSFLYTSIMTGIPAPKLNCVHVLDVADAHRGGGRRRDGADPGEVVSGCGVEDQGGGETDAWAVDTGKAERELGMEWRSYEMMVREVMEQQLGLLEAEGA